MNPNLMKKDDCNIRNSTNIPSHGSIPKWLEDISSYSISFLQFDIGNNTFIFLDTYLMIMRIPIQTQD